MIVFASCVADAGTFDRFAVPGLQRCMEADSLFVRLSHPSSIFVAYNGLLDHVVTMSNVEAVVLLHEDTEILDPDFCARVRAALREPDVAIGGVIGAVDVTSIAWWEGTGFGRVGESRGPIDFGGGDHDVAVVDGLLLVLSPWAVHNLRFDSTTFEGWHGYDADICAQALASGRRVRVFETDVHHHTKGGFGDPVAWEAANAAWRAKWAELLDDGGPADVIAEGAFPPVTAARPQAPTSSIVLPLHGRSDLTAQCLGHLTRTVAADVEIIVVGSCPPDDTRQLLQGFGDRVSIILEASDGDVARACNRGAAIASGETVVFLGHETVPRPGWLDPLLRAVARPGVVAAGPKLLSPDGTVHHAGIGIFDCVGGDPDGVVPFGPMLLGFGQDAASPDLVVRREVSALSGACLCVHRQAFLAVGGFDEEYRNGLEDVDLSLRLRLHGGTLVYEPASVLERFEAGDGVERRRQDDHNLARFTERWRHVVLPDVARLPDGRIAPVEAMQSEQPGQSAPEVTLARWRKQRAELDLQFLTATR